MRAVEHGFCLLLTGPEAVRRLGRVGRNDGDLPPKPGRKIVQARDELGQDDVTAQFCDALGCNTEFAFAGD